jgi:NADH-quinone oxidoreductase subunit L
MADDEGYSRFFAYMNLFVACMLLLVLAGELLVLLLGWEGVGLCSYLLIGFWYKDPANGRAAMKAFIVTRIGDVAFAIGLFLLFWHLGTLRIHDILKHAADLGPAGSTLVLAVPLLLLGGAVGKSAQLPLQTWLPDAMAGPTPVSALIHAATMVTAGVYLIARTHVLFDQAPPVRLLVAVIGAITLLLAGLSAIVQHDIKRVLAYSTISQIGYMFLALGVGAYSAAMFHFMTHAFFKALLFLSAGAVILAMHDEHDMFKMGGLRKALPVTFWCFLIGAGSLSALPLVTAGFYSKDLILWKAWLDGGYWLWAAGTFGAFITVLYSFRMVFVTFCGPPKMQVGQRPGGRVHIVLIVLAALSIIGGFIELPRPLGNKPWLSELLQPVLGWAPEQGPRRIEMFMEILTGVLCFAGIYLANVLWRRQPAILAHALQLAPVRLARDWWLAGWGFDWLYDRLLVRPFVWAARINRRDFFDLFYESLAWAARSANVALRATQNGRLRWYAAGIAGGAIVLLGFMMFRR